MKTKRFEFRLSEDEEKALNQLAKLEGVKEEVNALRLAIRARFEQHGLKLDEELFKVVKRGGKGLPVTV